MCGACPNRSGPSWCYLPYWQPLLTSYHVHHQHSSIFVCYFLSKLFCISVDLSLLTLSLIALALSCLCEIWLKSHNINVHIMTDYCIINIYTNKIFFFSVGYNLAAGIRRKNFSPMFLGHFFSFLNRYNTPWERHNRREKQTPYLQQLYWIVQFISKII